MKFLYEQGHALPNMERPGDHRILCREREGRRAEPESDGEDISDPPICPSFSEEELVIVRHTFKALFEKYTLVKAIGLYNAAGKLFVDALGYYANLCVTATADADESPFMFLHSTSTGSLQPGALYLKWKLPAKALRSSGDSSSSPFTVVTKERYADCVVYDTASVVNVVVTEVKKDEDSAIELNRWWGCDGKGNE